jgi:hypothetical protein
MACAVTALVAMLGGCTIGNQPPVSIGSTQVGQPVQTGAHRGPMTLGVDLSVVPEHQTDPALESEGRRDIAYIANVLHAQQIGIDFSLVTSGTYTNTIQPTKYATPSLAVLKTLTDVAKSYKLRVQYRVLFWVGKGGSSTKLDPPSFDTFFANLLTAETPFLQLAQQEGVSEFVVGTEKTTIEHALNWPGFFTSAAKVYHGLLSYAEWGGEPGQGGTFWGDGCIMPDKVCGITFYPDMSLGSSPTVAQLTHAMETDLQQVPASTLHRMEIDEMGIPATPASYTVPWNWNLSGSRDDQVQANWFTAACAAAHAEGMVGLSLWDMPVSVNPAAAPTANNIFTGRPAVVAAIQSCARGA